MIPSQDDEMADEVGQMGSDIFGIIKGLSVEMDTAVMAGDFDEASRIGDVLQAIIRKARELGMIPPDPFDVKT